MSTEYMKVVDDGVVLAPLHSLHGVPSGIYIVGVNGIPIEESMTSGELVWGVSRHNSPPVTELMLKTLFETHAGFITAMSCEPLLAGRSNKMRGARLLNREPNNEAQRDALMARCYQSFTLSLALVNVNGFNASDVFYDHLRTTIIDRATSINLTVIHLSLDTLMHTLSTQFRHFPKNIYTDFTKIMTHFITNVGYPAPESEVPT